METSKRCCLSPTLTCSSTMTNISSDQSDFDFWEFVSCAKCQLSFSLDAGTAVPFWLTQCGHVICNNHLSLQFSATPQGFLVLMLVYTRLYRSRSELQPLRPARDSTGSSAKRGLSTCIFDLDMS